MLDKVLGMFGKKFLAMLLGPIVVALIAFANSRLHFGLTDGAIQTMAGTVVAYILGQAFADGWSKGATSSVAQAKLTLPEAAKVLDAPTP